MTTLHDLAQLRLVAQRLVRSDCAAPVEAVSCLTALQAQDYRGALISIALRCRPQSRAAVVAALDAGTVVRSWPMRGTLHFIAADDLNSMLALLAPRAAAATRPRRAGLGLDERQLEWGRELSVAALSGGRRLRRADLLASWDDAGLDTGGQRGVHMLRYLAMTGTVVFGPTVADEQALVLVDEWIGPSVPSLDRDEALGQLARRYFSSHGPATSADLAAWAGLTAADLRTAVASARPSLGTLTVDGVEYFLDPRIPDRLADARAEADGVLLLPAFDEFILGYRDRRAQLDPAYADLIVPGGNGMFRPTVVSAGHVVGTWTRPRRGQPPGVSAKPFTRFTDDVKAALPALSASLP